MATATMAKPGRVRETWDESELYHVWAHQKAAYGRSRSRGNVIFQGDTIYSYGRHFPMGRLILKRGVPVACLLNSASYSNTTSGHQSETRRAVSHLERFTVPDLGTSRHGSEQPDHKKNLKHYADKIADYAGRSARSRANAQGHAEWMRDTIREGNRYAEFFGLKTRFAEPESFDAETLRKVSEEWKAGEAAREAKRSKAEKDRRAKALAEAMAKYETEMAEWPAKAAAWSAGGSEPFPKLPYHPSGDIDGYDDIDARVRLRVRGSRIESSLGAVFQIESAKPLLGIMRLKTAKGKLVRPDMEIDGYRGVEIDYDAKTVSVGCHSVAFEECERIAKELGL